ncbi:unnamed protein product [Staurois parvus]|uniref:Secreted protein n=1 Tax=Staurois parvus TaxID=386267 RepID=A0ABN9G2D0_9NEOB|nr:unnamed protein product [Staurois parvus]
MSCSLTFLLFPRAGRGLRCELVITMCDKLGGNILCSVFCLSEHLENSLHAFFRIKKRLWTALGTGRV